MIKFTHSNQLVAYIATAQKHAKNSYAHTRFDVLIALAHHVNMKTKSCFPSIARIAGLCCVSERTVMRILKEFTNSGLIKSTARYNSSSVRTFDFSKLSGTIGKLTKSNKLDSFKEQITTIVELIDFEFKGLMQAIQKGAFKRSNDKWRAIFTKKTKNSAKDHSTQRQQAFKALAKRQEDEQKAAQEPLKQFKGRWYTKSQAIAAGFAW